VPPMTQQCMDGDLNGDGKADLFCWTGEGKIIQRILRHSTVAVTQSCYIKTADSDASAAMQQFGRSLEYAPNMHLSGARDSDSSISRRTAVR
jgi:hypothetical protein